jgi:hypothetical protein
MLFLRRFTTENIEGEIYGNHPLFFWYLLSSGKDDD